MAEALAVSSHNSSNQGILDLWEAAGKFELRPSMPALGYAPHITFGIYPELDPEELSAVTCRIFAGLGSLRIAFDAIRWFDATPLVLWAAPVESGQLAGLHAALHEAIDPRRCHPHYRPGAWVPHCTLAESIPAAQREQALRFAARPIAPIEVLFDRVDCLSFPPVLVRERLTLAE